MQQKLSMRLIREKSRKLKIPYQNLLAAGAREWVLECLFQKPFEEKLLLKRTSQLGLRAYKTGCFQDLYLCALNMEITGQWLTEFITNRIEDTSFQIREEQEVFHVLLEVEFDRICIPITLHIQKQESRKTQTVMFPLRLIFENDKTLSLPCFYPEAELAELFADYFSRMELYPEMSALETIYLYATGRNLDGKNLSIFLEEEFMKRDLVLTEDKTEQFKASLNNKALQARYRGYLRSSKRKEPGFEEIRKIMNALYGPVLDILLKDQIFFGDWICEVQRYL